MRPVPTRVLVLTTAERLLSTGLAAGPEFAYESKVFLAVIVRPTPGTLSAELKALVAVFGVDGGPLAIVKRCSILPPPGPLEVVSSHPSKGVASSLGEALEVMVLPDVVSRCKTAPNLFTVGLSASPGFGVVDQEVAVATKVHPVIETETPTNLRQSTISSNRRKALLSFFLWSRFGRKVGCYISHWNCRGFDGKRETEERRQD